MPRSRLRSMLRSRIYCRMLVFPDEDPKAAERGSTSPVGESFVLKARPFGSWR